jgi:hypothetical protein
MRNLFLLRAAGLLAIVSMSASAPAAADGRLATDAAFADAAQQRLYRELDEQAIARSGRRVWTPSFDLVAATRASSPGGKVGLAQCGVGVCRIEVTQSSELAVQEFPRLLASHGAVPAGVVLKYHPKAPLKVTAYVLMPQPKENAAPWATSSSSPVLSFLD